MHPAKGILHCQYFSLQASEYWCDQAMSNVEVVLLSPFALIWDVELQVPPEPTISLALRATLKIDAICHFGTTSTTGLASLDSPKVAVWDTTLVASDLSTTSASLLSSFLHNLVYNSKSRPNLAQSVATPTTQQSQLQQNHAFNDSLIGTF